MDNRSAMYSVHDAQPDFPGIHNENITGCTLSSRP